MGTLYEEIKKCDLSKVLLYVLGEEPLEEFDRITEECNYVYHNLINSQVVDTDNVYTLMRLKSEDPLEYSFLYNEIKNAFVYEYTEFRYSYCGMEISDGNMKNILSTKVCKVLLYDNDVERFIAEIMRQIIKKCSVIKRNPGNKKMKKVTCSIANVKKYKKDRASGAKDIHKVISDFRVENVKREIMNWWIENENQGESEKLYWSTILYDERINKVISFLWNRSTLFKREPLDGERFLKFRDKCRQIALDNYCKGFLVVDREHIVVENTCRNIFVVPLVYVKDEKGNKLELKEFTMRRLLLMPIECCDMRRDIAATYLIFYLCYPVRAEAYRRKYEMKKLINLLRWKKCITK